MQPQHLHRYPVGSAKEDAVDENCIHETKVGKQSHENIVLEMTNC